MQRHTASPVTPRNGVPILVPAPKGEQGNGWASFFPALDQRRVREFKIPEQMRQYEALPENARLKFAALISLKRSIEAGDALEAKILAAQKYIDSRALLQSLMNNTHGSGQAPERREIETIFGIAFSSLLPEACLSLAVSAQLSRARLVLWWTGEYPRGGVSGSYDPELGQWTVPKVSHYSDWKGGGKFKSAIWCPDAETALYASTLFRPRSLSVCPKCDAVFAQQRPDQIYCSTAHQAAHRVARWRRRKKKSKA